MDRRLFLLQSSIAAGLAAAGLQASHAAQGRPPRILLRSSWQTVNIGDIAHTPGVLALLEKHLPQAEVQLWPSSVADGVKDMLQARFPNLRILDKSDIETAFTECDFLLHGSGPSLVALKDVERWAAETKKPYGVYGITFSVQESSATKPSSQEHLDRTIRALSAAQFVFFRDTPSMELAKSHGCTCPVMEFGPDGAFACDLTDDAKAEAFLQANGLEAGKFLCCIPRLRFTPYWTIPEKKAAMDPVKHARNEAMKEQDAEPLRRAIITIVENTQLKVLLCPEDRTQMAVAKEMLLDRLPDAIREKVVWREDYWLTDEALSTYRRSAGLFGHEMHSPIMCVGNGIPAIVCRWAEQTSKGFMWRDIGLGEWLFDFDQPEDRQRMPEVALAMALDPAAAKAKTEKARQFVEQRQRETMAVLAAEVGGRG